MINKKQLLIGLGILVIAISAFAYINKEKIKQYFFKPNGTSLTPLSPSENTNSNNAEVKNSEEVVAQNLSIPWEIAFLPDNSMLVTERAGKLKHVTSGTTINVEGVTARGEGGLLGMALHPDFASNNYIYLYSTVTTSEGLRNQLVRYKFQNNKLIEPKTILDGILGASIHDGGRIAFGPDKFLYITTGDAGNEATAQDRNSLNGKILRIHDDGSIPSDNPFGNAVYSYGHRNPQGLAWDSRGILWETEHGPSAIPGGQDELNKIEKGGNYGWPTVRGDAKQSGMINPVIHSTAKETWAPSGLAFAQGHLIFTGLRGQSLYFTPVSNGKIGELKTHLREKYGRLRTIVVGPDGYLYIATNNKDGRGTPKSGDDKIIRIKIKF